LCLITVFLPVKTFGVHIGYTGLAKLPEGSQTPPICGRYPCHPDDAQRRKDLPILLVFRLKLGKLSQNEQTESVISSEAKNLMI